MSESDKKQKKLDEAATYGRVVVDDVFAGKFIKIYEKGYVRVAGLLSLGSAPIEKLLQISASADIAKKSALGRTIAAGATMGLNLLSPNKRGDAYLTIVTESKTHSLHMDPPTKRDMQALHKIVTAGEAVLSAHQASVETSQTVTAPSSESSLVDQLKQLADLRAAGALTEEEFSGLKARLLGTSGGSTAKPVAAEESAVSSEVQVVLISAPSKTSDKIEQIKVLKETLNLELKAAKSAIDNPPSVLMSGVSLADAQRVAGQLKAAGIDVDLQ